MHLIGQFRALKQPEAFGWPDALILGILRQRQKVDMKTRLWSPMLPNYATFGT